MDEQQQTIDKSPFDGLTQYPESTSKAAWADYDESCSYHMPPERLYVPPVQRADPTLYVLTQIILTASLMLSVGCLVLFGLDVVAHFYDLSFRPTTLMPWSAAYCASSVVGLTLLATIFYAQPDPRDDI